MIITDLGLHIWRAETPDRPWQPGRTAGAAVTNSSGGVEIVHLFC